VSVSLDALPRPARGAWTRFRDEAETILDGNLIGLWGYGGSVFPDRSRPLGDLDTFAVIERVPDERITRALERAREETAREFGIEWDISYVAAAEARRGDPPPDALDPDRRLTSWAIDRAHWLAGWYVALSGRRPEEIVPAPTWPEIESALSRELEHLERHVEEGDDDPYEATYAIWNGSRILHAIATHDVAMSKRSGGMWALEHLPKRWHDAIRAADRTYDGEGTTEDAETLRVSMAPFVAMVRERLPLVDPRSPGSPPRWSGS
jgi:Aminoglycoside adenylyltransferase, C-terminal domain